MDAKPLSKEDRAMIELAVLAERTRPLPLAAINMLLAAEKFWREALGSLPLASYGDGLQACQVCRAVESERGKFNHKASCPWLLAQEEK